MSPPHHLASCGDVVMVCHPFSWDRIVTHCPRRGLLDTHPRSTHNIAIARSPSMSSIRVSAPQSLPFRPRQHIAITTTAPVTPGNLPESPQLVDVFPRCPFSSCP